MTEAEARADSARILATVIARRTAAGLGVKTTDHSGNTFTTYRASAADKADYIARARRSSRVAKIETI